MKKETKRKRASEREREWAASETERSIHDEHGKLIFTGGEWNMTRMPIDFESGSFCMFRFHYFQGYWVERERDREREREWKWDWDWKLEWEREQEKEERALCYWTDSPFGWVSSFLLLFCIDGGGQIEEQSNMRRVRVGGHGKTT